MRGLNPSLSRLFTATLVPTLAFCLGARADAAVIRVGPTGDHATIAAAMDAAHDGDTIVVQDGTYTENVDITKSIWLVSENGPDATVVRAADPDDHVVEVIADGVHVSDLMVVGAANDACGIAVTGANAVILNNRTALSDSDHNLIGICVLNAVGSEIVSNEAQFGIAGIYVTSFPGPGSSSGYAIRHNRCSSIEGAGVVVNASSAGTIDHNTLIDSTTGVTLIESSGVSVDHNIIIGNRVGISFDGTNNSIAGNTITESDIAGLSVSGGGHIVAGNTIVGGGRFGILTINAQGGAFYLNELANNSENVRSFMSSNTWSTPEVVSYELDGNAFTGMLGNRYDDHEDVDVDGDGILNAPYAIPGGDEIDGSPLSQAPGAYTLLP